MEADTVLSQPLKCPINSSEIISWREDEKVVDVYLNYSHESTIKSEIIKQEEIYIKDEEDNEDIILKSEKTQTPAIDLVLHRCGEYPYRTCCKNNIKTDSLSHKKPAEIVWYCCQECPYKTSRKVYLKNHSEVHSNVILKCSKCSYETVRLHALKRHQIKHRTNIQWLHCSECSFKTHLPSLVRKHLLAHKSDAFKCSKCSYQSRTQHQLAVHQIKHESKDKWHSCSVCSFKTHSRQNLKIHCRRIHRCDPNNPNQIEILKCTKCLYKNGWKQSVKTHQLIHDRNTWFQCPNCAYKTPYQRSLKKHQVQHQGENAEGWQRRVERPCEATSNYYGLGCHIKPHKSSDKIRRFQCPQCSFKTAHKSSLWSHQLKHKIEWFCCYNCSFKTKYKASLVRHISNHRKQIDKSDL